jgi:hypothetical protein
LQASMRCVHMSELTRGTCVLFFLTVEHTLPRCSVHKVKWMYTYTIASYFNCTLAYLILFRCDTWCILCYSGLIARHRKRMKGLASRQKNFGELRISIDLDTPNYICHISFLLKP